MYRFHSRPGAAATIASYPREVRIDFGVLEFGERPDVLTGYREKPEFSFQVSMGLYILGPVAWDYLTPGQPLQMPDLLETMRRRRPARPLLQDSPATGSTSAATTTTRRPTRSSRPAGGRSSASPSYRGGLTRARPRWNTARSGGSTNDDRGPSKDRLDP